MHLIITGASGFIGKRLIDKIINYKKIKKISLIYNKNPINILSNKVEINYINQDLTKNLPKKNFDFKADYLLHLGEYSKPSNKIDVYKYNSKTFDNILKILKKTKCKNFIYFSSTEAVGPNLKKKKLTETSNCKPLTDYGLAKLRNEKKLKKSNFKFTILRLSTIYGPGSKEFEKFFIINKIRIFPLRSDLKCIEYFFVDDLILIIIKILSKKPKNKTLNISPTKLTSLNEILNITQNLSGIRWINIKLINLLLGFLVKFIFKTTYKRLTNYYWNSSNSNLKKYVKFKETSFKIGVKLSYEYYQKSKQFSNN